MGSDEAALIRLWREKRGEAEPEDLSGNLIVQLGTATEDLNRAWYERNTGRERHGGPAPGQALGHSLDGRHPGRGGGGHRGGVRGQVHAALVVLRGGGGRKAHGAAAAQHVGHACRSAVLSIITGGGKWVEITIPMDPLYLTVLVAAEKKFWRCVQSGETPHLINAEPPRPRIEAIRIVDMSSSNSWAEFAGLFRGTRGRPIWITSGRRPSSRRCCRRTPRRRSAMGCGPSARSPAPSASMSSTAEAAHAPVQ